MINDIYGFEKYRDGILKYLMEKENTIELLKTDVIPHIYGREMEELARLNWAIKRIEDMEKSIKRALDVPNNSFVGRSILEFLIRWKAPEGEDE